MSTHRDYPDIFEAINDIADEINSILNDRRKDKYFDGVVLLFSFIENVLKSILTFFFRILAVRLTLRRNGRG